MTIKNLRIDEDKDEEYQKIPEKVSDQIELVSDLKEVKSSLRNNITSDYVLAHLDKIQTEFITENYSNAEYAKEIINRYQKGFTYEWDENKMDWVKDENGNPKKIPISNKDKETIQKMGSRTFEFFMIMPHMMAILNRNKRDNFMVKGIMIPKENEEEAPLSSLDQKSFFEKLKDKMSGTSEVDDGY